MFFALLAIAFVSYGQQLRQLPNDPAVRTGKLDNGLTYYIRHNDKPAGRAEFYLATNVGAIQETPDQDGLAHFLEHMCFNGTKNLPGKTMLDYLQKIGAAFGRNINAATGVEQTTYMLNNMPVTREGIIDTCLLIMHDYSHFVTCDPAEIDKERGVIIEEKRTRNNAGWRMFEKSLPYYYGDSKYSTCTLIGSQENLETFKPESLVNFYKTWYRPDLQAVIVVGDIDVDQIENKIKTLFSDIPAAENPQPKTVHKLPYNEKPVVGIITDAEASGTEMEVLWKSEPMPEELNSTDAGFMVHLFRTYISLIMSERFADITSAPDAPFIYAGLQLGKFNEASDAVMGSLSCKDGQALPALVSFMTEVEKMRRFGFSDAEVSRAKDKILGMYERIAQGADSRQNSEFINPLIQHFFDNMSYMDPVAESQMVQAVCAMITPEILNQLAKEIITDDNMIVVYKAPEKEGLVHPTEEEVLSVLELVKNSEIQANEESGEMEPLLDPASLKGSKVKKTAESIYGSTEWTLKNGVRVVVLPTQHRKDDVRMQLSMDGGRSLIPTEDLSSFESNVFSLYLQNTGVSKFPKTQLKKILAGKNAWARPFIGGSTHGIQAGSTPKDLETALQLLYLNFTQPRFDNDELQTGIAQLEAVLPNMENQPDFIFQKEIDETLYPSDPRNIMISEEMLKKVDVKVIERNYKALFKDAAGATVTIVGNVDLETLKPLVEKYFGSLPKGKKALTWNNDNLLKFVKGEVKNHFEVPMQTSKTTVLQIYTSYFPCSVKEEVMLDAAKYILDMIYTETLREDEGGTYGAGVIVEVERTPKDMQMLQVVFDTNPEAAAKLIELAKAGLQKLMNEGPTSEQLTMTVENFKKNVPENRINNNYWMKNIVNYYRLGIDADAEYEAAINEVNSENIKAVLKKMLQEGNFVEIVMSPETADAE